MGRTGLQHQDVQEVVMPQRVGYVATGVSLGRNVRLWAKESRYDDTVIQTLDSLIRYTRHDVWCGRAMVGEPCGCHVEYLDIKEDTA